MRLVANISMLFAEIPMLERFDAATKAGFDAVEIQFPYNEDVRELRRASLDSGMPIALINLPPGDLSKGEIGLAALPARRGDFMRGLENAVDWAGLLEVDKVNVLAGIDTAGNHHQMYATLCANVKIAGDLFAKTGVKVMLEAINPFDMPGFFVAGLDGALAVLDEINHPSVFLQFDFYHMARTEPSLGDAIIKAGKYIGHVQFADQPGRHEPGTGTTDFDVAFEALIKTGYRGDLSAEYNPKTTTAAGLGWMPAFRNTLNRS